MNLASIAPRAVETMPAKAAAPALRSAEAPSAPRIMEATGTGFAVPAVTGTVALMLQKHPTMKADDVRAALAISTKGGELPIDTVQAIRGADLLSQLRTQPAGQILEVFKPDPNVLVGMAARKVPGAPDVMWTDTGRYSIVRTE